MFDKGNYISNHLSCGSIFLTSDNKLIIGYNKRKSKFSFIGGMIDEKDLLSSNVIESCLFREISEEIGEVQILSLKVIGFFINTKTNHTNLVHLIRIGNIAHEIYKIHKLNLEKKVIEDELDEIIIIENDYNNINEFFIKNNQQIRGVERFVFQDLIIKNKILALLN